MDFAAICPDSSIVFLLGNQVLSVKRLERQFSLVHDSLELSPRAEHVSCADLKCYLLNFNQVTLK